MKKVIIIWFALMLLLCASYYSCNAQDTVKLKQPRIYVVQCAGKTLKGEQCKHQINSKNPGKSVMDAGGVYYCWMHTKQAKK